MKESQRGSLKVRVNAMCLDAVKIYGNNPKKLLIRINKKIAIKMVVLPTKDDGPKRVLNSLWSFNIAILIKIFILLGIIQ